MPGAAGGTAKDARYTFSCETLLYDDCGVNVGEGIHARCPFRRGIEIIHRFCAAPTALCAFISFPSAYEVVTKLLTSGEEMGRCVERTSADGIHRG